MHGMLKGALALAIALGTFEAQARTNHNWCRI